MAKDPAFLFYPGDWQGGTATLTRHLKGCYIDLLIAQFNTGPLSLEEIRIVLGSDFSAAWNALQKKFAKETSTGKFFNERLEAEKLKRAEYSKKQRDRINKRWHTDEHTTVIPINENRNENVNTNWIRKGVQGETSNLTDVAQKIEYLKGDSFFIEETCMLYGIDKDFCEEKLDFFLRQKKIQSELLKPVEEIRRHFVNWLKIEIEKHVKQNNSGKSKSEIRRDKFNQADQDIERRRNANAS